MKELVCGEIFEVDMGNGISLPGRSQITRKLRSFGIDWNEVPSWFDWQWDAVQEHPYMSRSVFIRGEITDMPIKLSGKLPKRLAKLVHAELGIKLAPDQLTELGNIAAEARMNGDKVWLDFTQSFDWDAGDFGDSGSCFWSEHMGARAAMENTEMYAIRLWNEPGDGGYTKVPFNHEGFGCGRAWIYPDESNHRHVLFNGYVNIHGVHMSSNISTYMAQVLATYLGEDMQVKRVNLHNGGSDDGVIFINSGNGYVVSKCEYEPGSYSMHINGGFEGSSCDSCGEGMHQDDSYWVQGDTICEYCFQEHAFFCELCEEYFWVDGSAEILGDFRLCSNCYDNHVQQCVDCSTIIVEPFILRHYPGVGARNEVGRATEGQDYEVRCDDCNEVYEREQEEIAISKEEERQEQLAAFSVVFTAEQLDLGLDASL